MIKYYICNILLFDMWSIRYYLNMLKTISVKVFVFYNVHVHDLAQFDYCLIA